LGLKPVSFCWRPYRYSAEIGLLIPSTTTGVRAVLGT
jgi:hypothetical protein